MALLAVALVVAGLAVCRRGVAALLRVAVPRLAGLGLLPLLAVALVVARLAVALLAGSPLAVTLGLALVVATAGLVVAGAYVCCPYPGFPRS